MVSILNSVSAQELSFERMLPAPPHPQLFNELISVSNGTMAMADVDGDQDLDVFISGLSHREGKGDEANLYLNDGSGNFTLLDDTIFAPFTESTAVFLDLDNDGDQDLFISGDSDTERYRGEVYINDGDGVFSAKEGHGISGRTRPVATFGDLNGDEIPDLVLAGYDGNQSKIEFFVNNGSAEFTSVYAMEIWGVADILIDDLDADKKNDVLIAMGSLNTPARLYLNEGEMSFREIEHTGIRGLYYPEMVLEDVDGDKDLDLILAGQDRDSFIYLYVNDGKANFDETEILQSYALGSLKFAFQDMDADGDNDLVQLGGSNKFSFLYVNEGNGHFSANEQVSLEGVSGGDLCFGDVDGDQDVDLIYTGRNQHSYLFNSIYINDGKANLSKLSDSPLQPITGSGEFADVDGDGDQDLLLVGQSEAQSKNALLYLNDGKGDFVVKEDSGIREVSSTDIQFVDCDADGDLDLLLAAPSSDVFYLNDGSGYFEKAENPGFPVLSMSTRKFADLDNDGDADIVVTGKGNQNSIISEVYFNDGNGKFSNSNPSYLVGLYYADMEFADIDGDDDLDMLIAGVNVQNRGIIRMYINDGTGKFSVQNSYVYGFQRYLDIEFADLDSDGDQDLILAGQDGLVFYRNDGSGLFQEYIEPNIPEVRGCQVLVSDFDMDDDMDLLIGTYGETFLYLNDGKGNFEKHVEIGFSNVNARFLAAADIDGDRDLDIMLGGNQMDIVFSTTMRTELWKNNIISGSLSAPVFDFQPLRLYPNPTNGRFSIDIAKYDEASLRLFDIRGRLVLQCVLDEEISTFELNEKPGIYFAEIRTKSTRQVIKLVLN